MHCAESVSHHRGVESNLLLSHSGHSWACMMWLSQVPLRIFHNFSADFGIHTTAIQNQQKLPITTPQHLPPNKPRSAPTAWSHPEWLVYLPVILYLQKDHPPPQGLCCIYLQCLCKCINYFLPNLGLYVRKWQLGWIFLLSTNDVKFALYMICDFLHITLQRKYYLMFRSGFNFTGSKEPHPVPSSQTLKL